MGDEKIRQTHSILVNRIKEYFKKNKFERAVIGLSGGIDSALSAKLVADAIGKENIKALIMPLKGLSSEENIMDAVEFCTLNGIDYSLVYINDFVSEFEKVEWEQSKTAKMNTISRVRAVILYNYANSNDALVIGTSNKTEILLGYFTKYGDGAVDIEVIGDLFKAEVRELAKFLGISEKITNKVPTAELYRGQTDEGELGASYDKLDTILRLYIEEKNSIKKIIEKGARKPTDNSNSVFSTNSVGFDKKVVESVIKRIWANEHKRNMPMVLKVKG